MVVSMDIFECINGRRSVRSYLPKPVEEEKIERLLCAGAMAPSAMNRQPCRFTVVEDKSIIGVLSDKTKKNLGVLGFGLDAAEMLKVKEDVIFYNAPLLIVVSAPKDDKWSKVDSALAAQNMMLAGYALGLGSCFIGFALALNNDKQALKELAILDGFEIIVPLIFGYPAGKLGVKERKPKVLKRM